MKIENFPSSSTKHFGFPANEENSRNAVNGLTTEENEKKKQTSVNRSTSHPPSYIRKSRVMNNLHQMNVKEADVLPAKRRNEEADETEAIDLVEKYNELVSLARSRQQIYRTSLATKNDELESKDKQIAELRKIIEDLKETKDFNNITRQTDNSYVTKQYHESLVANLRQELEGQSENLKFFRKTNSALTKEINELKMEKEIASQELNALLKQEVNYDRLSGENRQLYEQLMSALSTINVLQEDLIKAADTKKKLIAKMDEDARYYTSNETEFTTKLLELKNEIQKLRFENEKSLSIRDELMKELKRRNEVIGEEEKKNSNILKLMETEKSSLDEKIAELEKQLEDVKNESENAIHEMKNKLSEYLHAENKAQRRVEDANKWIEKLKEENKILNEKERHLQEMLTHKDLQIHNFKKQCDYFMYYEKEKEDEKKQSKEAFDLLSCECLAAMHRIKATVECEVEYEFLRGWDCMNSLMLFDVFDTSKYIKNDMEMCEEYEKPWMEDNFEYSIKTKEMFDELYTHYNDAMRESEEAVELKFEVLRLMNNQKKIEEERGLMMDCLLNIWNTLIKEEMTDCLDDIKEDTKNKYCVSLSSSSVSTNLIINLCESTKNRLKELKNVEETITSELMLHTNDMHSRYKEYEKSSIEVLKRRIIELRGGYDERNRCMDVLMKMKEKIKYFEVQLNELFLLFDVEEDVDLFDVLKDEEGITSFVLKLLNLSKITEDDVSDKLNEKYTNELNDVKKMFEVCTSNIHFINNEMKFIQFNDEMIFVDVEDMCKQFVGRFDEEMKKREGREIRGVLMETFNSLNSIPKFNFNKNIKISNNKKYEINNQINDWIKINETFGEYNIKKNNYDDKNKFIKFNETNIKSLRFNFDYSNFKDVATTFCNFFKKMQNNWKDRELSLRYSVFSLLNTLKEIAKHLMDENTNETKEMISSSTMMEAVMEDVGVSTEESNEEEDIESPSTPKSSYLSSLFKRFFTTSKDSNKTSEELLDAIEKKKMQFDSNICKSNDCSWKKFYFIIREQLLSQQQTLLDALKSNEDLIEDVKYYRNFNNIESERGHLNELKNDDVHPNINMVESNESFYNKTDLLNNKKLMNQLDKKMMEYEEEENNSLNEITPFKLIDLLKEKCKELDMQNRYMKNHLISVVYLIANCEKMNVIDITKWNHKLQNVEMVESHKDCKMITTSSPTSDGISSLLQKTVDIKRELRKRCKTLPH